MRENSSLPSLLNALFPSQPSITITQVTNKDAFLFALSISPS